MGYFNYFIKCIIRNIAYRLCKPKILFTVLLSVLIILLLHNTGYCTDSAWTEADVDFVNNMLNSISNNTNYLYSINSTLANSTNVKLDEIKQKLDSNNANLVEIKQELIELNNNVSNILKQLTGESSSFTFPLQGLLYCESIPDLDYGADVQNFQIVQGTVNCGIYKIDYSFKSGVTYTFSFDGSYDGTEYSHVYYTYDNAVIGSTVTAYFAGTYNANNLYFSITPEKDCTITLLVRNPVALTSSLGNWVVTGVKQGLINELQGTIDKNNQLQEESNKLQQEQNDILTDDNVETDNLQFATDDTVDPTADGFNSLFNTVYNAFCNTSSEPLTITLPYINKTFTIQPNIVSNGMQKAGLGVIVTLINSFYYFSVCLFIYKDISKIIDNLKSGNITSDCGNVKTEVL